MGFKLNSLILFITSSITGGGAWLGYELSKPKTVQGWVEWKGFKLASLNDDKIWQALFFQARPELKEQIKTIEELKQSCSKSWSKKENYSSSDLEYVQKFCTDNLKSRKAKIIAEIGDGKFLKEEKDFKVAFINYRYSDTFLSLLEASKNDDKVPEIADNQNLLDKYKKYCEEQLAINDSKTTLLKQICVKNHTYETAEQKLDSEGLMLNTLEDLKKEWANYKGDVEAEKYSVNTLFSDISPSKDSWLNLQKDEKEFGEKLQKWCDDNKVKNLYEKDFYEDVYPKFKKRCSKPKNQVK